MPPQAPKVVPYRPGIRPPAAPVAAANDANARWFNRSVALQFYDQVRDKIDQNNVAFTHVISVRVKGGPQSDLRRVWFLALATAFGRYRNRVAGVQHSEMEAMWDVTGKEVTVNIGYSCSGWVHGFQQATGSELSSPVTLFHRGPDQITVGGSWPAWTTTMAGSVLFGATAGAAVGKIVGGFLGKAGEAIGTLVGLAVGSAGAAFAQQASAPNQFSGITWPPVYEINDTTTPEKLIKFTQSFGTRAQTLLTERVTRAGGSRSYFLPWSRVTPATRGGGPFGSTQNNTNQLPTLPDDGRVITTGQKFDPRVQNPRPPLDGKSRTGLVSLVAAALTDPGFLPRRPPTGFVPLASQGFYIYNPGAGLDDIAMSNQPFRIAVEAAEPTLPPAPFLILSTGLGADGYPLPGPSTFIPNVRG